MRAAWVLAAVLTAAALAAPSAGAAAFNGKLAAQAGQRIIVVNPDGSDFRSLTPRSEANSAPAWQPGGRLLAFVSTRDGQQEIYVMKPNGRDQTRLTFYESYDLEPSFSPDGSKIVFTRFDGTHNRLYVMDADGSDQAPIGNLVGRSPTWSPDGTKIAYTGFGPSGDDIFVASSNGTGATNLTNSAAGDGSPRWTPDGGSIVFSSAGSTLIVDADGGTPAQFTFAGNPFNALPTFSPDGTAIASATNGNLYVSYDDGSAGEVLGDNSTVCCFSSVAWQPLFVAFDPRLPAEVTFGDMIPTTVKLSLGGTTDNHSVSIYERRNGVDALLQTVTVDADGNAAVELRPRANATYTARWEGDSTHVGSTSDTALVKVHALVLTRIRGGYGRAGDYRLYHAGQGVRQTAIVLPNHAGKAVQFQAQRQRADGRWAYAASVGLQLLRDSTVTAIFRTDRLGRYRVFNTFSGDRDHLAGRSEFKYFKVTG